MLAAIYKHGAPPSMDALRALVDAEATQDALLQYIATIGWSIGKLMYKEYFPPFSEMTKQKPTDKRTGDQIVIDVAAQLRKRLKRGESL